MISDDVLNETFERVMLGFLILFSPVFVPLWLLGWVGEKVHQAWVSRNPR